MIATHKLHVSPDRLAIARAWIAKHREVLETVTPEAQRLAVIGLLICNDEGEVSRRDLDSALTDSRAISAADRLISEVIR